MKSVLSPRAPAAAVLGAARRRRQTASGLARRLLRLVPYVPPAVGLALLPRLHRPGRGGPATGVLELVVTGRGGGIWTVEFEPDRVRVARGRAAAPPDTRLTLDAATWSDLATGRTDGTEAFMRGRLWIEGNMALTLKLDACMP